MAIVSVAITLSFHLKSEPTLLERRVAKPLGAVFWVLALLTLAVGLGNYIRKKLSLCIQILQCTNGCARNCQFVQ